LSIADLLQTSLPGLDPVAEAVEAQTAAGVEERGAIFTRREVVELILDLAGYTTAEPLHEKRLLEPSFGHGDFLLEPLPGCFFHVAGNPPYVRQELLLDAAPVS
jgi:hypothetical protein